MPANCIDGVCCTNESNAGTLHDAFTEFRFGRGNWKREFKSWTKREEKKVKYRRGQRSCFGVDSARDE